MFDYNLQMKSHKAHIFIMSFNLNLNSVIKETNTLR